MEDVAVQQGDEAPLAPRLPAEKVTTSGRRWESRGSGATVLRMWRIRLCYAMEASPESACQAVWTLTPGDRVRTRAVPGARETRLAAKLAPGAPRACTRG